MMTPNTLIALACMIANKGTVDTSALEAQMSTSDKAQIQTIIDSGACLPESLEKLIQDTHTNIQEGKQDDMSIESTQPTNGCG